MENWQAKCNKHLTPRGGIILRDSIISWGGNNNSKTKDSYMYINVCFRKDIQAPLEWGTSANRQSIERCLSCVVLL